MRNSIITAAFVRIYQRWFGLKLRVVHGLTTEYLNPFQRASPSSANWWPFYSDTKRFNRKPKTIWASLKKSASPRIQFSFFLASQLLPPSVLVASPVLVITDISNFLLQRWRRTRYQSISGQSGQSNKMESFWNKTRFRQRISTLRRIWKLIWINWERVFETHWRAILNRQLPVFAAD